MQDAERPVERPVADMEGRKITMEQYQELTPEKLELLGGYLIAPPDYPEFAEQRLDLLSLLLVNEGLLRAVRLAPPERWRDALRQVYGEP